MATYGLGGFGSANDGDIDCASRWIYVGHVTKTKVGWWSDTNFFFVTARARHFS